MQLFRSLEEIPRGFGPSVVSIGNFDGVHRGHQVILEWLKQRAKARASRSVAVTFSPHPLRVLRPERELHLITPLEARLRLLAATGIDAVLLLPFTRELSAMSAREFVTTILHDALRAQEVHEGTNFRFGHRAEGDAAHLTALGRELNFQVTIHEACHVRGQVVSSSRVRELIAHGQMGAARAYLGRSFFLDSTPVRGRGVGAVLTVPTINLAPYTELIPANGVYLTEIRAGEEWFDSVTNVGTRPTFGESSLVIESHLLNFHPVPLSEETPLELVFHRRLRGEKRWPNVAALKEQILRDVARAERYFDLARRFRRAADRVPGA